MSLTQKRHFWQLPALYLANQLEGCSHVAFFVLSVIGFLKGGAKP